MVDTHPTASRTVGVFYTGGTFGMLPSTRGYAPSTDLPARVEASVPGLHAADMPRIVWLDPGAAPVNSSDITPRFWFDLAAAIRAARAACDGFVIIHGTDTLAYTGSALSFLLADLDCPVVITGAGAPLGEERSDAADNLLNALGVAGDGRRAEVMVAFGGLLLRANRSSKRHGNREALFVSPNAPALAELGTAAHHLSQAAALPDIALPPAAWRDCRVVLLPVYPGIDGSTLRAIHATGIEGLILEGYPSGVGPGGDAGFVAAVRALDEAGVIVAAISQSRHGVVRLGRYASSTPLAEAGLIGGADMTREAALAKLNFLLRCGLDTDSIKDWFGRNLRGELTADD